MINAYPRGSRPASPAGGYFRAEKLVLRIIFYPFLVLTAFFLLLDLVDRFFGNGVDSYGLIALVLGIVTALFGLLIWKGRKAEARHLKATQRAAIPRSPRPGMIPDDQLTPEQQLVRKHFPAAAFETEERKRTSVAASEERMARYTPPLRPRTISIVPVDWSDAERSAEQWMQLNGYEDARRTTGGADGGVDVVSARGIAQVKHQRNPVGSAVIQQLRGAASSRTYQGRDALFFSSYGFTAPARQAALDMGVKLYQYDDDTWQRTS